MAISVADQVRTYDLLNINNHAVMYEAGMALLLDTGSSLTYKGPVRAYETPIFGIKSYLYPMSKPCGSQELGVDYDVLVGMDKMKSWMIRLDWATETAEVAKFLEDEPETVWIPTTPSLGKAPMLFVNHETEVALFDTGAQLSYRNGKVPETARMVGEAQDFNPHIGSFSTWVWEDEVELGGEVITVRFGELPPLLATSLKGVDWVIGSDILREFRVTLDFPQDFLGLKRRPYVPAE